MLTDSSPQPHIVTLQPADAAVHSIGVPAAVQGGESKAPVKLEHSYSTFGSDGDSMPESPLSSNDNGGGEFEYKVMAQGINEAFLKLCFITDGIIINIA